MFSQSLRAALRYVSCAVVGLSCAAAAQAGVEHPGAGVKPVAPVVGDVVSALDKCIFVVFQARDGAYWFGSDGQGVYRFDGKTLVQYTSKHGLCANRVRSIQQDRAGNILISAEDKLCLFDGRCFRTLTPVSPTPGQDGWRLDPDDLWFPGWQDSGVVYRYDGRVLHRLAFPKTAPAEDHLARFPRDKFPQMAYSPYDTYTVYRDSGGNLWFGTAMLGVCRYDGGSFAWTPKDQIGYDENNGFGVRSIIEDKQGTFWFSNTLNRYDVVASEPEDHGSVALRYRKQPGLIHAGDPNRGYSYFMSSVKDRDGDVWFATLRSGVWRYDGTSMIHYPVRDGDGGADVMVFCISQDMQGGLWVGTHEHGVYKYNGHGFEKFKIGP